MEKMIRNKLKEIENKHATQVLLAVESGSRAWGFASPDSDFDVRFIYKHANDWYLSLWEQKEHISFMTKDNIDGVGWDIRKSLKLLAKSNASILEWLFSPIKYQAEQSFLQEMQSLAQNNYNPLAGFYHYQGMYKKFEQQLDGNNMHLKSFFYLLRAALCANWIIKFETIPKVYFRDLMILLDDEYHSRINALLSIKALSQESRQSKIDKELIKMLQNLLTENENSKHSITAKKPNYLAIDDFYKNLIA